MAIKIQIRRGTAALWTSTNPILAEGEIGFETNTRKLKVGDGTTAWNSLSYYSTTDGLMGTAWDNSFTYEIDDIVGYGGKIYIALQSGLNKQPDSEPTYWEEFSSGGGSGDVMQALTDGTNIAWNVADGNKATNTIAGNNNYDNPTNIVAGMTLVLHQTQDGVGGRVPTFGSYFKFPAGIVPTPSSTAGATDIYEFEVVSTTIIRLTNFIKGY